jgi:hypothetical protein
LVIPSAVNNRCDADRHSNAATSTFNQTGLPFFEGNAPIDRVLNGIAEV